MRSPLSAFLRRVKNYEPQNDQLNNEYSNKRCVKSLENYYLPECKHMKAS